MTTNVSLTVKPIHLQADYSLSVTSKKSWLRTTSFIRLAYFPYSRCRKFRDIRIFRLKTFHGKELMIT